MMRAGAAPIGLARERAEDAPQRVAAARAEWRPLAALAEVRGEWRDLAGRALEPNVFYDPAFALPAARVFGSAKARSEEHTSELQSHVNLVCRLLLEKKKNKII